MKVRNAHGNHIGLQTLDENVLHTRWPCVSHPQAMTCEDAIYTVSKRGFRTLTPAPSAPIRRFIPPEKA